MRIEKENGAIYLSDSLILSSELTEEQFLALPITIKPYDLNAIPFRWYSAKTAYSPEQLLLIELCFFEGKIVQIGI